MLSGGLELEILYVHQTEETHADDELDQICLPYFCFQGPDTIDRDPGIELGQPRTPESPKVEPQRRAVPNLSALASKDVTSALRSLRAMIPQAEAEQAAQTSHAKRKLDSLQASSKPMLPSEGDRLQTTTKMQALSNPTLSIEGDRLQTTAKMQALSNPPLSSEGERLQTTAKNAGPQVSTVALMLPKSPPTVNMIPPPPPPPPPPPVPLTTPAPMLNPLMTPTTPGSHAFIPPPPPAPLLGALPTQIPPGFPPELGTAVRSALLSMSSPASVPDPPGAAPPPNGLAMDLGGDGSHFGEVDARQLVGSHPRTAQYTRDQS